MVLAVQDWFNACQSELSAEESRARARLARAHSRAVMIGTPIARQVCVEYMIGFAATCVRLEKSGIRYASHFVLGSSNLPRARNEIVARFLASDCTDLIFIDDDMGWNPDAIMRLIASEQPVIAGVGLKRFDVAAGDRDAWCVRFLDDADTTLHQDDMGAIEVAAVGTGLMKIERCVFEAMIAAHPEWKRDGHAKMTPDMRAHYYKFFAFDPDDIAPGESGEDYVFCDRWRALGGHIFIDPTITLSHTGAKAWTGRIADALCAAETLDGQR